MRQLTIAIEDDTLDAYREYARRHNMTLEQVVHDVLSQGVSPAREGWLEECFKLMDRSRADSHGRQWHREDLYDV